MPVPPRPIDSTLHGATDYTVGALLMTAFPTLAGIGGTRSARQIRAAGAIHVGYSTITDYPPASAGCSRTRRTWRSTPWGRSPWRPPRS